MTNGIALQKFMILFWFASEGSGKHSDEFVLIFQTDSQFLREKNLGEKRYSLASVDFRPNRIKFRLIMCIARARYFH